MRERTLPLPGEHVLRRAPRTHPVTRRPERRWEELSFAVVDADRDAMVALAREHGQFALFEWTPTERALVRCQQPDHPEDAVVEPFGWQARWEEPSTETADLSPAE